MALSPNLTNEDFPSYYDDWTFRDKIKLFESQVLGWQLSIANDIINVHSRANPHAGFAVLSILLNYFEMIGKYLKGYEGIKQSKKHFTIGFLDVFKNIKVSDKVIDVLYEDARCGMYHEALIGNRIILTGAHNTPIFVINKDLPAIAIDPQTLTSTLISHFNGYVKKIQESDQDSPIYKGFLRRFDFLKRGKTMLQQKMLSEEDLFS